jgi:hypothetical protein
LARRRADEAGRNAWSKLELSSEKLVQMSPVPASDGVIDRKRSEEPIFVVHVPGLLFRPIQP